MSVNKLRLIQKIQQSNLEFCLYSSFIHQSASLYHRNNIELYESSSNILRGIILSRIPVPGTLDILIHRIQFTRVAAI